LKKPPNQELFDFLVVPAVVPQVPKALLQPVPQWSVVLPHQPYAEQQLPKVLPEHVKPWAPEHVPSVDFLVLPAGVGVGVALAEVGLAEVAAFTDETGALPEQVPKAVLQPVPQWSVVEPQYPYCEQQLPKAEPLQVWPVVPAQLPSVETLPPADGEGVAALVEEVAGALTVDEAALELTTPLPPQFPKALWQPVPQ
jgi:hypothetical protein